MITEPGKAFGKLVGKYVVCGHILLLLLLTCYLTALLWLDCLVVCVCDSMSTATDDDWWWCVRINTLHAGMLSVSLLLECVCVVVLSLL